MSQDDPGAPDRTAEPSPAPYPMPPEQRLPPVQSLDGSGSSSGREASTPAGGWQGPSTAPDSAWPPASGWPPAGTPAGTPGGSWPPASGWPPAGSAPGSYPPPGYGPGSYPPPGYGPGPYGAAGYPPGSIPQWPGVPAMAAQGWSMPVVPIGPAPGLMWASIGSRLGALIVDAVLVVVAFFVMALIAETDSTRDMFDRVQYGRFGYALIWAWVLFALVYHPFCWWRFGGTPGQRILHLRVLRDADGQRLRLGQTVLRYVVWFACMLTVILAILAAIFGDSDPRKRTWPDEAAGTVVVKSLL